MAEKPLYGRPKIHISVEDGAEHLIVHGPLRLLRELVTSLMWRDRSWETPEGEDA